MKTPKYLVQSTFCRMTLSIFTGRPAHSAAMPVLFLLSGPKMGHVAQINVKFGTGERTEGSCHKHFVIISRENKRRRLPATSVNNLPWSGAAVCITLGSGTIDNMQ